MTGDTQGVAEHHAPPLGLHLIMGPDWGEMFANVARNLEEGRIVLYQAVARKAKL